MTSKQQSRHIIGNDPEATPTVCDSTISKDFLTATTLPLANCHQIKYNTKYNKMKCLVKFDDSVIMDLGFSKVCQRFQDISNGVHFIKSQCFYDVGIGSDNINCARSLVVKLLLSVHDTEYGIVLSADMPFGQSGLMNISRPAVLRTYYGLNMQYISPTIVERVTYGPTSTTGCLSMNPRTFSTKPMSTDMYQFGQCLKNFVKSQFEQQQQCSDIFDCDFNHCTILTYNVHSPNMNCKLAYHSDCGYDHKGDFKNKNTQGKNTAVIVYSLGDSRTLCLREGW